MVKKLLVSIVLLIIIGIGVRAILMSLGNPVQQPVPAQQGVDLKPAYARHEDAIRELMSINKQITEALETVKDEKTARSAAARLEQLVTQLEQLVSRISSLPPLNQDDDNRFEREYVPKLTESYDCLDKAGSKALELAKDEPTFMKAFEKFGDVMERITKGKK